MRKTPASIILPLLMAAAILSSCSSAYIPRRAGINVAQSNGRDLLVHERRHLSVRDLRTVVADNPLALRYAQRYDRRRIPGAVFLALGLGLLIGETVYALAVNSAEQQEGVHVGLSLGGNVSLLTGLILRLNARANRWDAINVYNDSLFETGCEACPGDDE